MRGRFSCSENQKHGLGAQLLLAGLLQSLTLLSLSFHSIMQRFFLYHSKSYFWFIFIFFKCPPKHYYIGMLQYVTTFYVKLVNRFLVAYLPLTEMERENLMLNQLTVKTGEILPKQISPILWNLKLPRSLETMWFLIRTASEKLPTWRFLMKQEAHQPHPSSTHYYRYLPLLTLLTIMFKPKGSFQHKKLERPS